MHNIVVNLDAGRRLIVHRAGGCHAEVFVSGGIGWVLDTEDEVPDHALYSILTAAAERLEVAAEKLATGRLDRRLRSL